MKELELQNLIKEELRRVLKEAAASKAQQQAAGIALSVKRGDAPAAKLKDAGKAMSKMSEKELEKLAGTKRKELPKKVKKEEVKKSLNSMSGMREVTVKKDDLDKIGDFIMSSPKLERLSSSKIKAAIKDMHDEWKAVASNYKNIEEYFDEIEKTGGEEAFMESKKPSKSKKSLKEGYAWERSERKFGEPLPTLASVQKAHQAKQKMSEISKLTEAKFQKGDRVKPLIGPHKGVEHEIIAVLHNIDKPGDDIYNIRPIGLKAAEIKYKLGAAGAKASDLEAS